jgi:hypothetical protein
MSFDKVIKTISGRTIFVDEKLVFKKFGIHAGSYMNTPKGPAKGLYNVINLTILSHWSES